MTENKLTTRSVQLDSQEEAVLLYGPRDAHLRMIRDTLAVRLVARGDIVQIEGSEEAVDQAERVFGQLRQLLRQNQQLTPEDVRTTLEIVRHSGERGPTGNLAILDRGKTLRPRTDGQARYVQMMKENDVVLCIGPAGTGKTFLAVGMAVTLLRQGAVKRIVLVRPAVEAGERLGFLPGDLQAKINPYLRPLFDALNDLMEPDQVRRYMENDIIEIAPLAYMRGRAQPLTSQVLTPFGFRAIGSLQVGDYVLGSDGTPTHVLGVFPQGRREIFRMTLTDGASTRCCGEHLWSVYTRDDRRRGHGPHVLQTRAMVDRLRCHHYHRFEIPLLTRPVVFPSQEVPIDPYALGLLLGDGCLAGKTTPSFATADTELVSALSACLPAIRVEHRSGVDYVLYRQQRGTGGLTNPLNGVLRGLGLWGTQSGTKFVPTIYLHNSVDVRLAVLQGLLDTDGGPVVQPGRSCRIQYTTISPRLRDDVLFLVRSLGGMSRWRVRPAAGRQPGFAKGRPVPYRADAFTLEIRLPAGIQPFRLQRKAERYAKAGIGRPMHYVESIEPNGVEEAVCIRVAAEDSLYVTDDFILTHNTINEAAIIMDEGQNTTVPQMKMFLTRMGHGSKIIVTGDITQIDLPRTTRSGLVDAVHRLRNIDRLASVQLTEADIVRHPLVQRIVRAYEDEEKKRRGH